MAEPLITQRTIWFVAGAMLVLWITFQLLAKDSGDGPFQSKSSDNFQPHIVVIGSGPTGIGAAWRLYELGYTNWTLVEMEGQGHTGGLAKSVVDENGFRWDHGVHVLFSHFTYFDSMFDMSLPHKTDWFTHMRKSPAWMRDRWVGYPVQNNVWQLPKEDLIPCLEGLTDVVAESGNGRRQKPANFDEWLTQSFGKGVSAAFMSPYNFKVWGHPPEELNTEWMGERVATIDFKRILRNMVNQHEDVSWGPNAIFRYPAYGSGQIWDRMFDLLPPSHIHLNKTLTAVVAKPHGKETKKLHFADGTSLAYDYVVSTIPIDKILSMVRGRDDLKAMAIAEGHWKRQTVNLVGVGVWGSVPAHLNDTHWIYFPEEDYVFYRATILSNFSPYMVARPGKQWSVVVEVSESVYRRVNQDLLKQHVVAGLIKCRFLPKGYKLATLWHHRIPYGYPVPYVGRNDHVNLADKELLQLGIWSRGRFGAWKYEVANQDHSFMQGVQAVNNILFGYEEICFRDPDRTNAQMHADTGVVKPPVTDDEGIAIPPPKKDHSHEGVPFRPIPHGDIYP